MLAHFEGAVIGDHSDSHLARQKRGQARRFQGALRRTHL